MSAKLWFLSHVDKNPQVVYLISADSIEVVDELAKRMGGLHEVRPLAWHELHELTGCVIPAGSNPHALASGNFMINKVRKPDIILWPI